jgi:hypothetical protein
VSHAQSSKPDRLGVCTQAAVDIADLLHPAPSVGVLELQDLAQGPMEVVSNEGYLLVELVKGVA